MWFFLIYDLFNDAQLFDDCQLLKSFNNTQLKEKISKQINTQSIHICTNY